MIELHEVTLVAAPVQRAFDLARSIDVHLLGNTHFGEQATAGTRTGLIGMGEQVTWRARHFWVSQELTSAITAFDPPGYFQDTMLRGAFRSMQHDHTFHELPPAPSGEPQTEMRDVFRFSAPLGPLGWLAERLVLHRYMRNLLRERNRIIQQVAGDGSWRQYVPE
jgi:ligand-binding SRPBCC domain-containing protein